MFFDLDAIGSQESVKLTGRFLVELQDHLNEAAAALPGQRISEIGCDLIRLLVFASVLLVLRVCGGPKATAEKVWS